MKFVISYHVNMFTFHVYTDCCVRGEQLNVSGSCLHRLLCKR